MLANVDVGEETQPVFISNRLDDDKYLRYGSKHADVGGIKWKVLLQIYHEGCRLRIR